MKRKILVSPDYGAGWSSWSDGETASKMLTYQPIIDYLEAGGDPSELTGEWKFNKENPHDPGRFEGHPLLVQLAEEIGGYTCFLGARNLQVRIVHGQVRIDEYDGNESVIERGDDEGWM